MKNTTSVVAYLRVIFYSLPVQLLFLHFRKYQILLIFWLLMFSVVNGSFMKGFGADALFLGPEYIGNVNPIGAAIMGMSIGVFIMCWNITTFILFSRHFNFLAATQFPFLKYCVNNSAIPLTFLIFYLIKAYEYAHFRELVNNIEILFLLGGFLAGLLLILTISFFYFFRADKTILKKLQPLFNNAKNVIAHLQPEHAANGRKLIHTEWFLDSFFRVRRCRDVSHYSHELMEKIFKRHHFAAVVSVLIAYLFLILIGFFLDHRFFQLPAGASITLFCAILIGVSGALVYFFQSWSVPALICILFLLNYLYRIEWIDPRNKAYGLNYNSPKKDIPSYSQPYLDSISASRGSLNDKKNMEMVLNRWKQKQGEDKPLLVLITTSGGGTRSATFTMNVLQRLDSITGGQIMKKTFLITGASGGMIGATYFRELYRERLHQPNMNLQSKEYVDDIAEDLLNPTFTSFIARDLFAPEQKFSVGPYTYLRDRGYAFESALNNNTKGVLDKRLQDYAADESAANIPLIFYHTVVTRDAKMMLISTQPLRFMMQPPKDTINNLTSADAIDFGTFFSKQDPYNLRILTALRMNATFPVVLPNIWMPSDPVIDVMDGGLRDNYGVENAMRFLSHMKTWVEQNTRGVLILQIRDRMDGGWENPYESADLTGNAVKPFFLLQNNWYKMMDYFQGDMATYFLSSTGYPIHTLTFQYIPKKEEDKAALNFHLTQREKIDISNSLSSKHNDESFMKVIQLLNVKRNELAQGNQPAVNSHVKF